MATKLGSIVLEITAKTGKFIKGIGKSKKAAKGFQNSLKALTGALTILGGATVLVVKRSLEAADAVGKAADTVGLGVEAYQEFAFAAEQAGVEQSQFTSNMTAFVKRVGEAKAGMGPLVSGLKNIDAELLKAIKSTTSQEQALHLMADAIQNAESETQKAALANAAFSRAGVNMTVFLRNGSEGLTKMAREANELGIVLSDTAVRGAEKAKDRISILSQVIAIKFTKAVTDNAKEIENLASSLISLIGVLASAQRGWASLFGEVKDQETLNKIEDLTGRMNVLRKSVLRLADARISTTNGNWIDDFKNFIAGRTTETATERLNEFNNELLKLTKERQALIDSLEPKANKNANSGGGDTGPIIDESNAVDLKQLARMADSRLKSLQDSYLKEDESLLEALERRRFIVEDAFQNQIINEESKNSLLEDLSRKHEDEKTKIANDAAKERNRILQGTLGAAASIFGSLSVLTAREGKKQSELQKTFARASIISSTAAAVMGALKTEPVWPLGFALASAAAVKGAEQLSKVGGGGGVGTSVAGLTQTATGIDQGVPIGLTNGAGQSASATQIVFTGDMLGEDLSERLIDIIRNATNDRDIVVFDSDSRQAQEIREAS